MAEQGSEEKKDEEEGQKEGGGRGEGAPVSRQSFNEEPLKLAVVEQLPDPQKEKRTGSSPRTGCRSLSLHVFITSVPF